MTNPIGSPSSCHRGLVALARAPVNVLWIIAVSALAGLVAGVG